jgi:hypothetical protein
VFTLKLESLFTMGRNMHSRNDKRLQRLLKAARFKVTARTEDIDYRHPRGLKQSKIAGLQSNAG